MTQLIRWAQLIVVRANVTIFYLKKDDHGQKTAKTAEQIIETDVEGRVR